MTLSTRLILLVTIIAVVLGASAYWISSKVATDELDSLSLQWSRLLTSTLGESLALDTINHNTVNARQTLKSITDRNSALRFAFIIDFDGRIFVHTLEGGFPQVLLDSINKPKRAGQSVVSIDGHANYLISNPIIEGLDARLFLGVDGELTRKAALHLGRKMIFLLTLITLLAVVASMLLGRRLAKPLLGVTQQLRAQTNVNLSPGRAAPKGNEITELVDAFYAMEDARGKATRGLNQFKNTLDLTLDCVFMFYPDSLRFFYVNTGAVQQVGYTEEELLNMTPVDIKPEYDEEGFRQLLVPLIDGSEPILHFETLHQHRNGTVIPVEISLQYISPAGEEPRFVAIVRDITEQKQAKLELETSRARFQAMFESISDAVVVADTDRIISLMNSAVKTMFGYEYTELLGQKTEVIYADTEDFQQTGRRHFNVDAKGNPLPYEIQYRRKDGSTFWGETLGTKMISATGEVLGFVGIIRDVSARRDIEEELAAYRDHLEELVKVQTDELKKAHAELIKRERLATVGQLTATVSHELRNPLSAVKSSLYVIRKRMQDADDRLSNAFERLERNVERCDRIVDELLDFTRVRETLPEAVVLDDYINEILEEENLPAEIDLCRENGLGKTLVYIDTQRMRRAVINVLENACHAMQVQEGGGNIKSGSLLKVLTRLGGERIEIVISDNGAGIPGNILPNIFEPLFSTKGFGVGLGLPTVRQIMQQHGGDIEAHSEGGKGTEMILWLPVTSVKSLAESAGLPS